MVESLFKRVTLSRVNPNDAYSKFPQQNSSITDTGAASSPNNAHSNSGTNHSCDARPESDLILKRNTSETTVPHNDSYFGKFSVGYLSDVFSSVQEKIYNVSEEASKQLTSLSKNVTSNISTTFYPSLPNNQRTSTEISTENQGQGLTQSHSLSSSSSGRKWFMMDPYNTVTGRTHFLPTHHRDSVNAVRNLLQFVDSHGAPDESMPSWRTKPIDFKARNSTGSNSFDSDSSMNIPEQQESDEDIQRHYSIQLNKYGSDSSINASALGKPRKNRQISKAVTASRLGEGTIRAMRDMALSEALELHNSLRFWTERLERPLLYYIESGPRLWASDGIDHHAVIGEKVSQLQAVLARRCSSIGELQQHLWRAGWQSGVENWGILGQGEWAAVVGNHGSMRDDSHMFQNGDNRDASQIRKMSFFKSIRGDGTNTSSTHKKNKKDYYAESHLFVKNVRGGEIVSNDSALAAWSIDAIRVVRDQLYSAGNGLKPLPYFENWPRECRHFQESFEFQEEKSCDDYQLGNYGVSSDLCGENAEEGTLEIPLWAEFGVESHTAKICLVADRSSNALSSSCSYSESSIDQDKNSFHDNRDDLHQQIQKNDKIMIKNLSLMAAEVNELLNSMETYMTIQRKRRLEKLKPPPLIRRNWYIIAMGVPMFGYIAYNLITGNRGTRLAREAYLKLISFCSEHISEPMKSIYRELFTRKGREDVTDRKARDEVISVLQKMIKSWLDEVHPDMPENERAEKAFNMDMSLIENTKEDSVKNIFEIHNIYRLSLIEMQFIKKEMMNALFAMDELMGSNEINIKLAAMTPAFLLASSIRYLFRKLFYALLKIGKSREETYTQFRHLILDIERLLVMRDNPPSSAPPLPNGVKHLCPDDKKTFNEDEIIVNTTILGPDDLGMLMLLVHECRVILWQDRKRFSRSELRNVSEDLAELAGERGAVSVQQQLRIIARMCRTYSFLKVISSGIPFSVES